MYRLIAASNMALLGSTAAHHNSVFVQSDFPGRILVNSELIPNPGREPCPARGDVSADAASTTIARREPSKLASKGATTQEPQP